MCDAEGVIGGNGNLLLDGGVEEEVSSFRFLVGVSGRAISTSDGTVSLAVFVGLEGFLAESRVNSSRTGLLGVRRGVRVTVDKDFVGEEGRDGAVAPSIILVLSDLHLSLRILMIGDIRLERIALS
jgi:hypothetical protein